MVVNGAVSLGSGLTLDVVDPAGPLGHGHYPLILASGAITGLTPSTFTISGAGTNIASIASITTGGSNELVLNVVGVDVGLAPTPRLEHHDGELGGPNDV